MQRFDVTYEYPVYFTRDVFAEQNPVLAEAIARLGRDMRSKIAVFVDDGVTREMPDLARRIASYAQAHGADIELAGAGRRREGRRGLQERSGAGGRALQSKLVELGLDRHSYVVAVGGGAVLDVVGYVAATTHRGIRHIRIPTTVLAQNDSGVGVKNGVNAFGVKNLLGTFVPPVAVHQRLGLHRRAARARQARRHGRGGQGGADPRPRILRPGWRRRPRRSPSSPPSRSTG